MTGTGGTNGEDRRRYEEVEHALAARVWRHTQHYADAKSDVVRAILARASGGGSSTIGSSGHADS